MDYGNYYSNEDGLTTSEEKMKVIITNLNNDILLAFQDYFNLKHFEVEDKGEYQIIGLKDIEHFYKLSLKFYGEEKSYSIKNTWEDLIEEIEFQLLTQGWPFIKLIQEDSKGLFIIGPYIHPNKKFLYAPAIRIKISNNGKTSLMEYNTYYPDYMFNQSRINLEEESIKKLNIKQGDEVIVWLFIGRLII